MKKTFTISAMLLFGLAASSQTTFNYTGSVQMYIVPPCVDSVTIDAWGAAGANATDKLTTNSTGGKGGYATGTLGVNPGDTLYVYVGGKGDSINGTGGYNGGGNGGFGNAGSQCFGGFAGGGGGASDVRVGDSTLASRVIVAGGGGGAGRDYCNGSCQPCGCGGTSGGAGGLTGADGQAAYNCGFGYAGQGINNGKGATQSAGGTGGPGDANGPAGNAGVLGIGGNGAGGNYDVAGGGGGGGYYGGGGGGGASSGNGVGGGGAGGGSSYIGGVVGGMTIGDTANGHGVITITPIGGINLTVSVTPNDTVCEGEQVTLTGGGADTYSWDNGVTDGVPFTASTTTTYTMVGTDTVESCSDSTTFTLTVLPAPDATFGFTNPGLGYNFTNTEGGGVSWEWDFGDGDTAQTQNPSHVFPAEGQYIVCLTVTDTNGCSSTSCDTIDAAFPVGIWTKNSNDLIKVFPNPAKDVLFITSNHSLANAQVTLYSIEGKTIQVESRLNGNQIEVALPGLKPGIYSIRVTTDKGVAQQQITVQ